MAPATRRSSGLGANANSPSNLDHILEHFNQFKRKHITQNRDIIKTNALAQLRIKELEEKILALEAEQTKSSRELIHVRRRMERAEKAAVCMRQGWQLIGAGMSAMSAIEGFDRLLDASSHPAASRPMSTQESLYALQRIDDVRPSTRITLDPNALPGGVARNVSRPPEADLNDVMEERSAEMIDEGRFIQAQGHQYEHMQFGSAADMHKAEATLESDDDDDDDDGDSEHGDDEDVVSFGATDGEDTIRMQGGFETSSNTTPMITETSALEETTFAQAAARDHAELSGSNATASASSSESAAAGGHDHRLKHMPSIDSLSSFADDEEIELSTDDEDEQAYPARSLVDMSAITNALASHASRSNSDGSNGKSNGVSSNGKVRKRKTPSSPDDHRHLQSSESISCSQSEAELSTGEEASARPSRRASMRDRKSVNYALPKLNTKMRKPDPVDLIPAARSETKQRDSLMTSHRGSDDEAEEPAKGRMSDGPDDRPSSADTSQTSSPNPKILKGQHGVASTGNLREIRKLHEQQQQKQQQQQQERQKQEAHQGRRRASSQSDNDSTPRMDSEGMQCEPVTSSSSSANDSPRRRSSRKSQRRLSSSSTAQSDGTVTASEKAEEERETDSASNYSDAQTDSEMPPHGHLTKATAHQTGLSSKSSGGIANAAMAPTPRQKESNPADATMNVFGRGSLSAAATVGTPIPKPVIRNGAGGMPHGNIKALKVAGRMQKSSSTNSGLSNLAGAGKAHAGQRQAPPSSGAGSGKASLPLGPAGVKANSVRQFAGPHARSVSAGAGKMGGSTGGAVNGGPQSLPTANTGDPTKRNSLHAAMTTD